jgi:hypothetical protein
LAVRYAENEEFEQRITRMSRINEQTRQKATKAKVLRNQVRSEFIFVSFVVSARKQADSPMIALCSIRNRFWYVALSKKF